MRPDRAHPRSGRHGRDQLATQDRDAWQLNASGNGPRREVPGQGLEGGWLTERELEVLRELPSMMTLSETAAEKEVSLNTVKTHVRSIYSRFNIGSRRDAIAVARRRGLL